MPVRNVIATLEREVGLVGRGGGDMIDGYGGRCFNVTGHKFPKRYEILGYAESIPYNYLLGFLLLAEVWPK